MTPGVPLDQLIAALSRKQIPLPFELGAFIVLEVSERVVAHPALVNAAELRVSEDGEVLLPPPVATTATTREMCKSLCTLLGELLVCSAESVPPMLLRLVEAPGGDGPASPAQLRDELEATLVPMNRAAMRRVLARLVREARREHDEARPRMSLHPSANQEQELDAVLGGGRRGAGDAAAREQAEREERAAVSAELDAVLDGLEHSPARPIAPSVLPNERSHARAASAGTLPLGVSAATAEVDAATPAARGSVRPRAALALGDQGDALDRFEHMESAGSPPRYGLMVVGALVALAAIVLWLVVRQGPSQTRALMGLEQATPPAPTAAAPRAPARVYGALVVTSQPAHAQVFVRIGRSPALATKLPRGVAHEFVALRGGFSPARDVVPADAQWEQQGAEFRYELALQLRKATSGRDDDVGASLLPLPPGTPTGGLGTVRLLTSPPDAEVYQLVGFAPDVRVENQPIDEAVELLVALPGYETKRVTVSQQDYREAAGQRIAAVNVTLARRAASSSR